MVWRRFWERVWKVCYSSSLLHAFGIDQQLDMYGRIHAFICLSLCTAPNRSSHIALYHPSHVNLSIHHYQRMLSLLYRADATSLPQKTADEVSAATMCSSLGPG